MSFATVIRWIDDGFRRKYPGSKYAMALLMSAGGLAFLLLFQSKLPAMVWIVACAVLFGWRLIVILRQMGEQGDRAYDHAGKYKLSAEYHRTESTAAALQPERKRHG